jgi:hypothetical protein
MTAEIQNARAALRPDDIVATIRRASARTGSDFDYLLNTAMRESSLQPQAKSKHSSATGLFQFIDQTWLGLVKRYGARHGLGALASAIEQKPGGTCSIASEETRAAILALRKDPEISALMAGEAARESEAALEGALGRDVSCGELYAAHFLGQGGAKKLLSLNESDPAQRASLAFPQAAKANRSVFYRADGTARTIGEVYAWAAGTPAKPALHTVMATASAPKEPAPAAPELSLTSDSAALPSDPLPRVATAYPTPARSSAELAAPPMPQSMVMLTPAIMEILASVGSYERETRKTF